MTVSVATADAVVVADAPAARLVEGEVEELTASEELLELIVVAVAYSALPLVD